jgi:hypothetical protein
VGDNNKRALAAGLLRADTTLPDPPRPTATVVWENGATLTVPVISAGEALRQLTATAGLDCPECVPLVVTDAHLTTAQIQTTRGRATVPVWEYTLKGTTARVTRVAVAGTATVTITPPSLDPHNPPDGLRIESASASPDGRQLAVIVVGAREPASQPCGADYSVEAVESAHAVAVIVTEHRNGTDTVCPAIGFSRTVAVELARPLDGRAVLEVQQGLPVPLMSTPRRRRCPDTVLPAGSGSASTSGPPESRSCPGTGSGWTSRPARILGGSATPTPTMSWTPPNSW